MNLLGKNLILCLVFSMLFSGMAVDSNAAGAGRINKSFAAQGSLSIALVAGREVNDVTLGVDGSVISAGTTNQSGTADILYSRYNQRLNATGDFFITQINP